MRHHSLTDSDERALEASCSTESAVKVSSLHHRKRGAFVSLFRAPKLLNRTLGLFSKHQPAGAGKNQIIPFSDTTFWIIAELVLTIIFTFCCFSQLPSIMRQVRKPFPGDQRGRVTITLTWRKIFRSMMRGLSFSTPPGNSTGQGRTGEGGGFSNRQLFYRFPADLWNWGWQDSHPPPLLQKQQPSFSQPSPFSRTVNTHPCR